MNSDINNLIAFKCWVKTQLVIQETSQRALAKKMNISYPRISEALSGHPSGKKYIIPLIEQLGGDIEDFRKII